MRLLDVVLLRQFLNTYLDVLLAHQVPARKPPIMLRTGETFESVLVVLCANLGITAQIDPDLGLRLLAASPRCFDMIHSLRECMRPGGIYSDVSHSLYGRAGNAVEQFGYDGSRPRPARPEAQAFADALLDLLDARAALVQAEKAVPSYTGQYDSDDYTAAEQERLNRAVDALFDQIVPPEADGSP